MEGFGLTTALLFSSLAFDISVCKENLAVHKKTTQSSYLHLATGSYIGAYAVDGNNGTAFFHDGCFHTDRDDPSQWWTVDLGASYAVASLRIFNRGDTMCACQDRLVGFKVYVSGSPASREALELCYHSKDKSLPLVIEFNCSFLLHGRYVTITLESTEFLTLCEVEVYGSKISMTAQAPLHATTGIVEDSFTTTPENIQPKPDNGRTLDSFQDAGDPNVEIPRRTFSTIIETTTLSSLSTNDTPDSFSTTVGRPTVSPITANDITPDPVSTIDNTASTLSTTSDTPASSMTSTDKAESFSTANETPEPATASGNWPEHTQKISICPGCRCPPQQPSDVDPKLYMSMILSDLEIDKTKLSSNRRKYESVVDDRPSVKYIGGSGLLITCLILGVVFLLDLEALVRDLRGVIHKMNNNI